MMFGVSAWAITRINGNQLLEASGEHGFSNAANREGGAASAAPRIVMSIGQGVMAHGTLPEGVDGDAFMIGAGLGYDIAHYLVCPVAQTGDLSRDGRISATDLIMLVAYIYKSAPELEPCAAVGDVNCSGNLTSADLVYLVNYIFKGQAPPCNVCSMIPDTWPCF